MANSSFNDNIGLRWLAQAEGEHASIASFARHTLKLMSIGAPSELLGTSQQAGNDEISHAKMCYGLSSSFLGYDYEPRPIDIEKSLGRTDLTMIVYSLVEEGCIEETISAFEAHLGAHTAKETSIKAILSQIASDETNHAQLAWNTVDWILKKYSGMNGFVEKTFRDELSTRQLEIKDNQIEMENSVCNDCKMDEALKDNGLVADGERKDFRRETIKSIIEPIVLSGLKDVSLISKSARNCY